MNHIDEATLIWGNKWNWYQQIDVIKQHREFDKLYLDVSKHFNDNLYHDLLSFRYFCSFFGNFDEMFWDVLCDKTRIEADESELGYRFLSDGTIIVIKNGVDYVIDKKTSELIGYSTETDVRQVLMVDELWWESWQGALKLYSDEENYPGKYVIHKFPQKENYIFPQNVLGCGGGAANELYFFDNCANFLDTVKYYGIPKKKIKGLENIPAYDNEKEFIAAQLIEAAWKVSQEGSQNLSPLLVDPRIVLALGDDFVEAKKEADERCGREIIFTPQSYIDWIVEQNYLDLPVTGIDPKQFMIAIWEKIKTRLLDDWKNKIKRIPPPEYRRAKDILDRAREVFRNGDFETAVMLAGKCCEILCFFEYPNNERVWSKLIYDHKEDIINRYGHAVWHDLMELRKKRNPASHANPDYRPDDVEADGIIKRAEIVWNKFNVYRIQNPA